MNQWHEVCLNNDKKNQIRMIVDGQNFVFFFAHKNNLYGTHEQHRVTFAKLVSPEFDEDPEGWEEDANFMAVNLSKAMMGKTSQHLFKKEDLSDIDVVASKEDVYDILQALAIDADPQQMATGTSMVAKTAPKDSKEPGIPLNQNK
jgi:hypothetical protein